MFNKNIRFGLFRVYSYFYSYSSVYIFVHISSIVSGYSYIVHMLVTRLKSDMC